MSSKVGKEQDPIPYQALLDENHALKDESTEPESTSGGG